MNSERVNKMKAILISDHAKWCALMMNGKKKTEVRKGTALYRATQKLINEYGYAEFYVYCTKEELLFKFSWNITWYENFKRFIDMGCDQAHALDSDNLNGKVLFKFRCYKVEELFIKYGVGWQTKTIKGKEQVEKLTQLSVFQLFEYCGRKTSTAIHISDLEIFDKPKELSEFKRCTEKTCIYGKCHKYMHCLKPLTKAPQNFCYVELEKR